MLSGHDGMVMESAFHPDGHLLVTASSNKSAGLWDLASMKLIARLGGNTRAVTAVAFSLDGMSAVSASSDKSVREWDAANGSQIALIEKAHRKNIVGFVFRPDAGAFLTVGHDKKVRIWEARSGTLLKTLVGHTKEVETAAFSRDGRAGRC